MIFKLSFVTELNRLFTFPYDTDSGPSWIYKGKGRLHATATPLSKKDLGELCRCSRLNAVFKIEQANAGRRQGTIFHDSVLKWRAREYNYISETRSTNVNIPQTVLRLTQTFEKTRQNNETRQTTYVCLECLAAILMDNYLRQTNKV